ncbi:MAG: ABC transporter substrate-binding protein [Cyanobacteriota bacterium]|nr:ABC transporter substrate-binding protein [Cyanobacteriota bacterium]
MTALHLQLDWKPGAQFAGLLFAHYLGWYRDANIHLDIHPWQPFLDPVSALERSGNWLVITEDNLLLRAIDRGDPYRAIGTMMQYSGLGWIALKSSGIRQLSDLKGKRVGIHGDGEAGLKISLAQVGLTAEDVEIVEIGYDYPELLGSGDYDAVQTLVMVEPLELAEAGFDLQVMPAYEWGYQVYSEVIATTDDLIARDPETLRQFLRVTWAGWRAAFTRPREASQAVVEHYLNESTPDLQQAILMAIQPLVIGDVGLERLGSMHPERWAKSIQYLTDNHLLKGSLRPEQVMTTALLE